VRAPVVVDTNVPIVANGRHANASCDCVLRCIDALENATRDWRVLLDEGGLILDEYRRALLSDRQPSVGRAFFKWLWDNQANEVVCRKVAITHDSHRVFAEFPDNPELSRFDRSDRKFVAVALASQESAVEINASDTDWRDFLAPLRKCGVCVRFLCPDLMTQARRPNTRRRSTRAGRASQGHLKRTAKRPRSRNHSR
jgi:hypothetical protein